MFYDIPDEARIIQCYDYSNQQNRKIEPDRFKNYRLGIVQGKYGLLSREGKQLTTAKYDRYGVANGGALQLRKGKRWFEAVLVEGEWVLTKVK